MAQDNGQSSNHAIDVIRHLKEMHSPSLEGGYQTILVALAKVYRKHDNNIVHHGTMSVIKCEKEVYHVSEHDFLEAIRHVFQPKVPIIYPTQFRPAMIIHPDGSVLWMDASPDPKPAPPAEESTPLEGDEPA